MRYLLLLPLLLFMPSCRTERTVLAGPKKVSMGGYNDYNPNLSGDQMASQMSATGQSQSGGGAGFNDRFSFDSGGYGKEGLNIMSDKVFGGSTNTKYQKDFTQTKDYLTKRYGTTKEFGTRENSAGNARSWLSRRSSTMDRAARETGERYSGGNRILDNTRNRESDRIVTNRSSREDGRSAFTRDFYPAKKVLDQGGDKPKLLGEGTEKQSNAVWDFIKGRPRDNPATVQEIRDLLGKKN